ncbi:MAG: RraA family protein [Chloroflexi bacterium]|nr:RraA family protein [Chloroflexota bacterium]
MHISPTREQMIAMTPLNPFDRFPDGRPWVPDTWLERMKLVTTEEAWGTLHHHGYRRQFEGNWKETHPNAITVGRAVTAAFIPHRPDFHQAIQDAGVAEGRGSSGGQNAWVINSLQMHDVMVVDLFGKVKDGTMVGDNLGTAVRTRTRAGAVIDGGIRDFQGLVGLTDVNFYMRGMDPTAIADVTLLGINIPVRIGGVTVLPGDVILGTPTGVMFIPPHLVQQVVESSEDIRVRDEFGKLRIEQGRWSSGEIDSKWSDAIEADFAEWKKSRS